MIEDDADVLDLLLSHVRHRGCAVVGTSSGEQGRALAAAEPPDLVVVDILLPDIDGWAVVRGLRADLRTRRCRVVVSSVLDPQDLAEKVPVDALLPKPFSRGDVLAVLDAVLGLDHELDPALPAGQREGT